MKRSPLHRFTPLVRKTPIRRVSTRQRRRIVTLAEATVALVDWTGGWCQFRDGDPHFGEHAHHVRRRSQGGGDTPANLRWLCWYHHRWVHDHPAEAARLGLLELRREAA